MKFIEALFQADALAFGKVEDFFVVEEAGKLVGGASGFVMDSEDYRPLRLSRLAQVAALLGWDDAALGQFRAGYEGVWRDPKDVTLAASAPWTIECVAVRPEARGRGIAKTLLRAIVAEGKRLGHSQVGIAVTNGNEPARRVYEALGFQLYVMYGAEYFDGMFPGTTKYRMRLGESANGKPLHGGRINFQFGEGCNRGG
jgi:ribosomal protein S18 acetylase RimI-like enzyme